MISRRIASYLIMFLFNETYSIFSPTMKMHLNDLMELGNIVSQEMVFENSNYVKDTFYN